MEKQVLYDKYKAQKWVIEQGFRLKYLQFKTDNFLLINESGSNKKVPFKTYSKLINKKKLVDMLLIDDKLLAKLIEKACIKGDLNVCKWLYYKYAVEFTKKNDINRKTFMYIACEHGHLTLCKWFYDLGAIADIKSNNLTTTSPMFIACSKGHLPVCEWLYKVGAHNDVTRMCNGLTPMYVACSYGHLSVCKWLYNNGASHHISQSVHFEIKPMWNACSNGHMSVCKWLYNMGATRDVNCVNSISGYAPIHITCNSGNLLSCKWLFEVGADITLVTKRGETLMHLASKNGNLSVCKWLLNLGADINKVDKNGDSPISYCCNFGLINNKVNDINKNPVIKWLILNGALNDPFTNFITENIVMNKIKNSSINFYNEIISWTEYTINNHKNFLIVLDGSVLISNKSKKSYNKKNSKLHLLKRDNFKLISEYLDIAKGNSLRNVKQSYDIFRKILLKMANTNFKVIA